jgi:hypothetical protein
MAMAGWADSNEPINVVPDRGSPTMKIGLFSFKLSFII